MFEQTSAAQRVGAFMSQRDQRADGGRRQVRVTRSDILIQRRFAGIAMLISVPVAAYRGVALAVEQAEGAHGGAAYRLSLAHADPDLDVVLFETQDSGAAAADWKYWSFYLDLPRLAAAEGEAHEVPGPAEKQIFWRRRLVNVAKRRPRFLTRRKRGQPERTSEVFAGEREIVCYE
jgi:hypothetical protein